MRRLGGVSANGGTAMYDAVAEAVPLAAEGSRAKKAVVLISDGNDTHSQASLADVRQLIRETEVLVYAIGIGGADGRSAGRPSISIPMPGGAPPIRFPLPGRAPTRSSSSRTASDGVNVSALRELTDDSGGRTELVDSARDLDPATAGIADELSQQYFLGYVSSLPKDGRWHQIQVRLRRSDYTVRARKGYVAD